MAVLAEPLLRNADFDEKERLVCLRAICQVAAADGKVDPAERAYLKAFVEEFFEGEDPTDEAFDQPVTSEDLKVFRSDRAKDAFVAFLYTTAYVDEDFSDEEREFIERLTEGFISDERREELLRGVREMLYRRAVFAYAHRFDRLDEEFARKMAERFDVPEGRAVELNAQVFNALMALKGAAGTVEQQAEG